MNDYPQQLLNLTPDGKPGAIWFVAHFNDDGTLSGFEEHDWRDGGYLRTAPGRSVEEHFLETVRSRCGSSEYADQMETRARELLRTHRGDRRR